MAKIEAEIVVIGAGPAGTATAWALARSGHDVLILDSAEFPREKTCGDGLTPMAVASLERMGVLNRVEEAAMRLDQVGIQGPFGSQINVPFCDCLDSAPQYALVLPRLELDNILLENALVAGAKFIGGRQVRNIVKEGDRIVRVTCKGPSGIEEIHAQHFVIAVGANTGLLVREGFIPQKEKAMRAARAYFKNVDTSRKSYDFYFDLPLVPGYGWIFPVEDGVANIGVTVTPIFWASRRSTETLLKEFIVRRQQEGILGEIDQIDSTKGYTIRIDFPSQRVAGTNWVIVGEATGLVNPVTGEGIDLAMESGLLAADLMSECIRENLRDHRAYQKELRHRYGAMFVGLRLLRNVLVTPVFVDYCIWLMKQWRFVRCTVVRITQGFELPQRVLHPLFIFQFFVPLSPRWLMRQLQTRLANKS